MNWETRELLNDLQIVKEKIDDVMTSFTWFDEEYFTHNPKHVLNKDEILVVTISGRGDKDMETIRHYMQTRGESHD